MSFTSEIIKTIKPMVKEIIIVSDNPEYDQFGVKRIPDLIKGIGPLAGLYSGLTHSTTTFNLVVGCDMPLIHKDLINKLYENASLAYDIVQFKTKSDLLPLLAIYQTSCKDVCKALLESGERRLLKLRDHVKTRELILVEEWARFAVNLNTPEQVEELKTNDEFKD